RMFQIDRHQVKFSARLKRISAETAEQRQKSMNIGQVHHGTNRDQDAVVGIRKRNQRQGSIGLEYHDRVPSRKKTDEPFLDHILVKLFPDRESLRQRQNDLDRRRAVIPEIRRIAADDLQQIDAFKSTLIGKPERLTVRNLFAKVSRQTPNKVVRFL